MWKGKICLRGDFVGGISAHHVQNGQAASGMIRHPRVEAQNIVLEDDNDVAIGNHGVNLLLAQDAVAVHFGSRHVGKGSWCGIDSRIRIDRKENVNKKGFGS